MFHLCSSASLQWDKHAMVATTKPLPNLFFKIITSLEAELNVRYVAVRNSDCFTLWLYAVIKNQYSMKLKLRD